MTGRVNITICPFTKLAIMSMRRKNIYLLCKNTNDANEKKITLKDP